MHVWPVETENTPGTNSDHRPHNLQISGGERKGKYHKIGQLTLQEEEEKSKFYLKYPLQCFKYPYPQHPGHKDIGHISAG